MAKGQRLNLGESLRIEAGEAAPIESATIGIADCLRGQVSTPDVNHDTKVFAE
jgi:hypothetical protein